MTRAVNACWIGVLLLGLLGSTGALVSPAAAADIEGKWRVALGAGGYNPVDDLPSPAANSLLFRDFELEPTRFFQDPRDDSSVFGNLDLQSGFQGKILVQYGISKIFLIEASVGYMETDLGDVALDVQFLGDPPEIEELDFNFTNFRVNAGTVERIPIQLTGIVRFRPRAKFNPYFGGGIGYVVQGYESSSEFDELSFNMDNTRGTRQTVGDSLFGDPALSTAGPLTDLDGAKVDVRDTFEWHVLAGAELSFKNKWAVFGDVRWTDASRDIRIGFNGSTELGFSIPQFEAFDDSPLGQEYPPFGPGGGPILITQSGLIDGGQIVFVVREEFLQDDPTCDDPSNETQRIRCELVFFPINQSTGELEDPAGLNRLDEDFEADGELDPGFYYVHGGSVSIDGFTLTLGVRYTF